MSIRLQLSNRRTQQRAYRFRIGYDADGTERVSIEPVGATPSAAGFQRQACAKFDAIVGAEFGLDHVSERDWARYLRGRGGAAEVAL